MCTLSSKKVNFTLLSNVGSVLVQQLTIYGISLLTFGIIARLLPPEQMGLYAIVVSVVSLVSAMANLGVKRFSIRMISAMEVLNDKEGKIGLFWTSTILSIVFIVMISGLATYLLCLFNVFEISNPYLDPILFYLLLLLYSLKIYLSSGLEGLKLFHRVTVYVSSGFLLYRILMIYAALMGYGVTGIMAAWCIGELLSISMILRDTVPRFTPFKLYPNIKEIITNSLPLTASDTVLAAVDWADRIVVSIYGYSEIAIFYIATTGITFLSAIAQAIYSGTLPHLSEAFHKSNPNKFSHEIRRIGKHIVLFTLPIYMLALALGQPTIIILVGPRYLSATIIFQIMAFGLWITALNPLLHTALIAAGKSVELMYIMILSLAADIFFLVAFYPYLGLISAGIGRALFMATSFTLSILIAQKIIDLDIDIPSLLKSMVSSTIMALMLIIMWTYIRHISLFPIYILIGLSIYFGMIRVLKVISINEIITLYSSLPGKLKFTIRILCYLLGIKYKEVIKKINQEVIV